MKNEYKKAYRILKKGGVIIFPTDTVMGIGCMMTDGEAIKRMYRIKKRPLDQPTAVLVSNRKMAYSSIAQKPDKELSDIMEQNWPGALTIVLEASKSVPIAILGKGKKVGIRIPAHEDMHQLIDTLGIPIVATSANVKGGATPVKYSDVEDEFIDEVDFALPEDSFGKTSSTVIEYLRGGKFKYIRKGIYRIRVQDMD